MKKLLAIALCLLAVSITGAAAAETWPARPVKVIVGFAPGGPTDLFARLIAQSLTGADRKEFLRRERARRRRQCRRRAGGAVAARRLYDPGDRRQSHQQSVPVRQSGLRPLKDFDAVTVGAATPVVLAVNPSVPAKTVKELVAWIRANPGKESYASPGTGTPPQLAGALFAHSLNLDLVHVPFGGGGPAVEATVGGHTPISFGAHGAGGAADQVRRIARACGDRQDALADAARRPDHGGSGLPRSRGRDLDRGGGAGRHAEGDHRQAARPDRRGLAKPTSKTNSPPWPMCRSAIRREECEAFFKSEMAKWGKVIKDAGLKAE